MLAGHNSIDQSTQNKLRNFAQLATPQVITSSTIKFTSSTSFQVEAVGFKFKDKRKFFKLECNFF